MMKHALLIFLLSAIVIQLFQALFYQQSLFKEKYDNTYWKDRYEHSQYSMPLSKRIIGDDGLYAYAGSKVILGSNPTTINVDKPPVGKYLIGFSILIFNSPAYYAFIICILTIISFYFLSKKIFGKTILALLTTALLVTDPLFIAQSATAWIDMPQLLFLLLNILFLWLGIERKKRILILLSGLSLGLYIETKPTALMLPMVIFEGYILLNTAKNKSGIIDLTVFLLGGILGIFIPYFKLFMMGETFLDVIKYHKFMAVFYLMSKVVVNHWAIWQALFLGHVTQVGGTEIVSIKEWNLIWFISGIVALPYTFYILLKNTNIYLKLIAVYILFSFIFFTVILSYPRYLLSVLPFLYIIMVLFFSKFEKILSKKLLTLIIVIIILYGLINSQNMLTPKLQDSLNNFKYSYSGKYFQDIYQELLSKDSKIGISRDKFHILNIKTLSDIGVENITVKPIRFSKEVNNEIKVDVEIYYKTLYLGSLRENKELIFKKENKKWKLVWKWDYLLNDFRPGYVLSQHLNIGTRGTIFSKGGTILASDSSSYLLSINPALIDINQETNMLKIVSRFSRVGALDIQNRYNENPNPNSHIPIATLYYVYPDKSISELRFPGVDIAPQISRIYYGSIKPDEINNTSYDECCSRIYSSTNYHGIKGIEKQYDNILSGNNGGELLMKDQKGNLIKIIKQVKSYNGQNIYINL